MRYVGGKGKLAKKINALVIERMSGCHTYLEPFMGGGATAAVNAPMFDTAYASDVSPDLVAMWNAVRMGWEPPTEVDDDLYQALKQCSPSALRGFVGFGCSFGGKWFGGRARGGFNANGQPRNHAAESARAVAKLAPGIAKLTDVRMCDYRDWRPGPGWLVYADPPYSGTQGYAAAGLFSSADFWQVMNEWVDAGAVVLVSEYSAPQGWIPALTASHTRSLQHGRDGRHSTVETVWERES